MDTERRRQRDLVGLISEGLANSQYDAAADDFHSYHIMFSKYSSFSKAFLIVTAKQSIERKIIYEVEINDNLQMSAINELISIDEKYTSVNSLAPVNSLYE